MHGRSRRAAWRCVIRSGQLTAVARSRSERGSSGGSAAVSRHHRSAVSRWTRRGGRDATRWTRRGGRDARARNGMLCSGGLLARHGHSPITLAIGGRRLARAGGASTIEARELLERCRTTRSDRTSRSSGRIRSRRRSSDASWICCAASIGFCVRRDRACAASDPRVASKSSRSRAPRGRINFDPTSPSGRGSFRSQIAPNFVDSPALSPYKHTPSTNSPRGRRKPGPAPRGAPGRPSGSVSEI